MDETHAKALSIFYPEILRKADALDENNVQFVQYTSADAAMSIIKNKEIWLRNTQCMNDYREIDHGIDCLITAFKNESDGKLFQDTLENIFPGIIKEIIELFDGWLPHLRSSTYIACVSEHPQEENAYGRLSMWRAYGGKRAVALVLNKEPFRAETDIFHAYSHPVAYQDADDFSVKFGELCQRIKQNSDFVEKLGRQGVINYIFDIFKTYALCTKHPGFSEEREWRVVYNPAMRASKYISSNIESIDEIPQEVYKIPLKNIPEGNFYGATIPEFIEKIIIGPNDHQLLLGKTFEKLLENAGCENPWEKIKYSGIPLR